MLLPYQEIFVWAMVISFILSLIYRFFTNPKEIRQIKKDMQFYRDKSKEAQKKKETKKANEYMSEMMKLSQKQMKLTMKPMFISMAVVLLLLGYIGSAYGGIAVELGEDGTGEFTYGGESYALASEEAGDTVSVTVDTDGDGDLSDETPHASGQVVKIGDNYWSVTASQDAEPVTMEFAVVLPFTMPILGWTWLNWLFWYVLCTLPATLLFRRFLGVE